MSWLSGLESALDERLGTRRIIRDLSTEPVPGGASFAHALGRTSLVLFGVQLVTGAVMALYYSPSVTDAWASVAYLERQVSLGSIVRGMHHHGSSALVALTVLHLLQAMVFGAYRRPREVTWLSGLLLLGLVLLFTVTGYLLPWDQTAYWATKVRVGILGSVPVVGPTLQGLALGGNDLGNLTLTRFYALHVILLPGAAGLLVALHVAIFRKHGITPPPNQSDAALAQRTELVWPKQVFLDAVLASVVIGGLVYAGLRLGAPLDAPADPSTTFIARPEWYFLFLFQLLKYFQGSLQIVGSVILPGLASTYLALLPWLDRSPSRRTRDRRLVLAPVFLGLLAMAGLTVIALRHDAADQTLHEQQAIAAREAQRAKNLAAEGVPPAGAAFMLAHDPLTRGERLFAKECASCHVLEGRGPKEPKGPDLTAYLSKAWLRQVLRDPDSPRLYGRSKAEGMESFAQLPAGDLERLVDFLYALRDPNPPALEGHAIQPLIEDRECDNCHDFADAYGLEGPTLLKFGSREWVLGMINDAGAAHYYGEMNDMPAFERRLSEEDRQALVVFLASLEARASSQAWPFVDDPGPVPTPRAKTKKAAPEGAPAPEPAE